MAEVLFLAHRIPFPPDKGDKIRSWHMLRHLAERHTLHLGCFIDDERDWQFVDKLRQTCGGECHFAPLSATKAKLRALPTLLFGSGALTLPYYRDRHLARWLADLQSRRRLAAAVVFCSAMAPYVMGRRWTGVRRILDMVDVDSDKWSQLSRQGRWPMKAVHAREARALLAFEREAAAVFDGTILVSPREAELFRHLAPEVAAKVSHLANGVDADYFSPERDYENPFAGEPQIVFTGAMDYWPNVDAVDWFVREVLPIVQLRHPEVGFAIVGSNPTAEVKALAAFPGVTVTGRVPDIRPYLAHAAVIAAPLRIARGIQNKVLEAMAMARPVVATPQAVQGIEAEDRLHLRIADGRAAQAEAVLALLGGDEQAKLGRRARDRVLWAYSWSRNLGRIDALLGEAIAPSRSRAV